MRRRRGAQTPAERDLAAATLLVGAVERQVELLRRQIDSQCRGSLDPETVHDQRVALRRLVTALRLMPGRGLSRARRRARALLAALGEVRDLHVQLEWLSASRRGAAARRMAEREGARLTRREGRAHAAAERWARREAPRLERRLHRLSRRERAVSPAWKRVARGAVELERALDGLAAELDPRRAHRARILAKRLRYQVEVLRPLLGSAGVVALRRLTALQTALGELHDLDVRLALISRALRGARRGDRRGLERLSARVLVAREEQAVAVRRELGRWGEGVWWAKLRHALDL